MFCRPNLFFHFFLGSKKGDNKQQQQTGAAPKTSLVFETIGNEPKTATNYLLEQSTSLSNLNTTTI